MRIRLSIVLCGVIAAVTAGTFAEPPSFTPLGDLPGGTFLSAAGGMSNNGSIIAGWSISNCVDDTCNSEAFLWQAGSMTGLGFPSSTAPFPFSGVQAVSGDGSILAGSSSSDEGTNEPFRWQGGVFTPLGRIPGYGLNAHLTTGISNDGSRIVGWGYDAGGQSAQGWLWDDGTMMGLSSLSGSPHSSSSANGISGDGNVIVGGSDGEAFRWVGGTMTGLGFLPSPFPGPDVSVGSWASSASNDGGVIVGSSSAYDYATDQSQQEAFRWSGGMMVGLGDLPGGDFNSYATIVSDDGSLIAGGATTASGYEAFLWDSVHGIRGLRNVLESECGLDLTGWTLLSVSGISTDGMVIAGTGINPNGDYEAFRAVMPEPGALALLAVGLSLLVPRLHRKSLQGSPPPLDQINLISV